ncbi:unnamed protein product [Vicia faba]|uniref:Zinc finger CCCH domain-containing protein 42 n=1 Tax=Vicia faba TaxID=3906 RepID=A0AAV0YMF9_VICFA|nr:unnamed protein product [Vicia faba]
MNPLTLVKRIQKINSREAALGISEQASWHTKYKDSAYVFVGGIPFDLTEGDLLAVFAQYGEVVDVNLVRDKDTGKSKGFAFLAYEDQRSTNLAVDNLNGAQVLGRIIRVDHVDKYKKKEEEDEETERQKREARGVCRAFQKGECTRGAGCKFSHDEQRAANTGWGEKDNSKWDNDKYDGPKRRHDINQSNRFPETRDRDSRPRAHSNMMELDNPSKRSDRREEKMPRRHNDVELEHRSKEDQHRREEKRSRNDYDDREPEPRDHRREDKRSIKREDVEFKPRSRDSDVREDKRLSRQDVDDFRSKSKEMHGNREERRSRKPIEDESVPRSRDDHDRKHGNREERRSRKHTEEESVPRSRKDQDGKLDNISYRNNTHRSESKGRYDSDPREDKRS